MPRTRPARRAPGGRPRRRAGGRGARRPRAGALGRTEARTDAGRAARPPRAPTRSTRRRTSRTSRGGGTSVASATASGGGARARTCHANRLRFSCSFLQLSTFSNTCHEYLRGAFRARVDARRVDARTVPEDGGALSASLPWPPPALSSSSSFASAPGPTPSTPDESSSPWLPCAAPCASKAGRDERQIKIRRTHPIPRTQEEERDVDTGRTRAERCLLRRRSNRRLLRSQLSGRFGHVDARRGQVLLHRPTRAKQLLHNLLPLGCVHRRRLQHRDCAGRAGIAPQRRRGPRDQLLLLLRRALVAVF